VIIEQDSRNFIALGAAGTQDLIYFPDETVSVLDAVSLMGGVSESTANPKAVLILREYALSRVRYDGTGPDRDRVIFTLDLTTADGLFSARNFRIEPDDLVLATESPLNSIRSAFSLFSQAAGVVRIVN
jgi:polysaccharide export outer membrane protein